MTDAAFVLLILVLAALVAGFVCWVMRSWKER